MTEGIRCPKCKIVFEVEGTVKGGFAYCPTPGCGSKFSYHVKPVDKRCGTCFWGTEVRCPHVSVVVHGQIGGYCPTDNGPPWENCRSWKPMDWKREK